jgi:hypothetical protein
VARAVPNQRGEAHGPQSVAIFGRRVARNDPDHFAALVVTQILGGSRRRGQQEVREARAAYWVYALMFNFCYAGLIGGVSPNEQVAQSPTHPRLSRPGGARPHAGEVDAAKSYLIGLRAEPDSNAKIAEQMLRSSRGSVPTSSRRARRPRHGADATRVARRCLRRTTCPCRRRTAPERHSP